MRIPLVIRESGVESRESGADRGRTVSHFVTNADIAPTLLDLVGLPVPEIMQGQSMKPLIEGETPANWRTSVYYHYWQHLLHRDVTAHYGLRTDRYKLIYYHGLPLGMTDYPAVDAEWALYDLENDPLETTNVYDDPRYADVIDPLKAELLEKKVFYGDTDDAYPELVELNERMW